MGVASDRSRGMLCPLCGAAVAVVALLDIEERGSGYSSQIMCLSVVSTDPPSLPVDVSRCCHTGRRAGG